jgi:UDP-N-acetylmuramate--alanine ligase
VVIVCKENEHTRQIIPQIERRMLTYGLSHDADMYARNIGHDGAVMHFEAVFQGQSLGEFTIPVPGVHNVLNSLAAITVALQLGVSAEHIRAGLAAFSGIQRRFELKGEARGVMVYDDYGHHPVEIRAVLQAARDCFADRRLVVIFQPHRYSRTRDLLEDFAISFTTVDELYLMDIYAAGEQPIEGISSAALRDRMEAMGFSRAIHMPDRPELVARLKQDLRPGDIVFTLGAGDVYKIGEEILNTL